MKTFLTLLAALLLTPLCTLRAASAPALIAHWAFDEGSGVVLHDKSGNNHDGAIHDATWVQVGDGFGLQFGAK